MGAVKRQLMNSFDQFVGDMQALGLEVKDFASLSGYQGPAVLVPANSEQEVRSGTEIPLEKEKSGRLLHMFPAQFFAGRAA